MAKAAVICAACGAKVRSNLVKCLRCRQPLVARQEAPPHTPARPIPWKTVGVVAGCIALGGVSVLLTGGAAETATAQPVAAGMMQASVPQEAATANTRLTHADSSRLDMDPATVAATNLLAGQKAYSSGNLDGALERLQAAVEANPNDHRALNDLAQVLARSGRAKDAIPYLEKAVQLAPDSWTYQFNRARAYAQVNDWEPAIQGYRTAAQLFPDDYATQYNLAKALQASGNLKDAIGGYEKAIQLAPGQSDFQLSYGLALEAAKRPQDAAAAYSRFLELEPQSPETEKVRAHLAELQPTAKAASGS